MEDAIDHFIWGYQKHFCVRVESAAIQALGLLHGSLNPRAFVVGVRISNDGRFHPACVEPEHHYWVKSEALYDVLKDVGPRAVTYPEASLRHSHPIAQQRETARLHRRALKDAVLARLRAMPNRPTDANVFLSFPVERPDFLIMVGLEVSASALATVPTIENARIQIHEHGSYTIAPSLVHATIDELLSQAARSAMLPDADGPGIDDTEYLIRRAGEQFLSGLLHRIDQDYRMAEGWYGTLSKLSLLPYERATATGILAFWPHAKADAACELKLNEKISLRAAKPVRKLLTLTTDGRRLVCDATHVRGLASAEVMTSDLVPSVDVRVIERGKWSVSSDGHELMHVADGFPKLPKPPVVLDATAFELRRRVPELSKENASKYAEIARVLALADHGAVLVIDPDAESEAVRLRQAGLAVEPFALHSDAAELFGRIDGAVLCDAEGRCHAIGVILDGSATEGGDRGRGARFNSSDRYIKSRGHGVAAMVVSEDGGLTLLPILKPSVRRSELMYMLEELRELAEAEGSLPDRHRQLRAIEWVKKCAHVLTSGQCDSVNGWIKAIQDRFYAGKDYWIVEPPLIPDPAFDPARDLY